MSRGATCDPTSNTILGSLSPEYLDTLNKHFECVYLELGQTLFNTGEEVTHVYFPMGSVVSVTEMLRDGSGAEVALIGREGMIGTVRLLGGKFEAGRCLVQHPGHACRIPAEILIEEFNNSRELREPILRFIQAIYTQLAYLVICSGHHTVQQRLCRWLLLIMDRADTTKIKLTHALLAGFLGVRREGVTIVVQELQQCSVIEHGRGYIHVIDRPALERLACECYEELDDATDRWFEKLEPRPPPTADHQ